jgi:2-polyprenyl-6-methoxyphenol hydroxylase-like FAD-dependent oxidoreductase
MNRLGQHAIVIGGSIAGLMTARVLADFFASVTVLERDQISAEPAIHKSIPQGNHLHLLLLGGQQVLSQLYPNFSDNLQRLGAVRLRAGKDMACFFRHRKAYSLTGSITQPHDLGFDFYCQSRGLLEYCVRQATLAHSNVKVRTECPVAGLIWEDHRVQGVRVTQDGEPSSLEASLVVDAGGRGSRAPRWLKEMGFQVPVETAIGVDFAYSSVQLRIPGYAGEPERMLLFLGPAPHYWTGAAFEAIENDCWHLSLFGRFGDYPPADRDGFFAFAREAVPSRKLYQIIKDAELVIDIVPHRFPTSVQRHYERLAAFPERFVVLGDAISSFNPVYGQGMSSAALQVGALRELLTQRADGDHGLDGLAPAFFAKAAEVIFTPWTLAAGSDFAYPQTTGERPVNAAEGVRYFAALDALAIEDLEVSRLIAKVFQLAQPLSALFNEPLLSRVLAQMMKSGPG